MINRTRRPKTRSLFFLLILGLSSLFFSPISSAASATASAAVAETQSASATTAKSTPQTETVVGTSTLMELTLKQAYEKALQSNPTLKQAQENVNQMGYEIPLARSTLFPTLTATGQGEEKKDPANNNNSLFQGESYDSYTAGLHGTQPLFQIGIFSAVDSARKDRQISQYNLEISTRNLGASVIQAYFQVVLNMRAVDSLLRQERIVTESLKTTEHRFRTGRSQLLDVLQVKTQIALLVSQVADAKNQMQISAANLANILGEPHAKSYTIRNNLKAPDLAVIDRDVDLKKFHLPELEQNKVQINQIDDKIDVTRGQNLPTLNLFGDYNFNSFKNTDLFDGTSNSWDAGITLTIPLFSGFSSFSQVDQLKSQKMQLEFARQNLENQTNLQQVTSRKQVETARADVIAGEEALKLAKQSSDEAIRQYRLATIDFLNFLTIQTSYVQAEQSLNTYKYNYLAALANYYSASGQEMGHLVDLLEEANR
jgi:outer membrane protein